MESQTVGRWSFGGGAVEGLRAWDGIKAGGLRGLRGIRGKWAEWVGWRAVWLVLMLLVVWKK